MDERENSPSPRQMIRRTLGIGTAVGLGWSLLLALTPLSSGDAGGAANIGMMMGVIWSYYALKKTTLSDGKIVLTIVGVAALAMFASIGLLYLLRLPRGY